MKRYKIKVPPALLCGREIWVTAQRARNKIQAAEIKFLLKVKGYTK